MSEPTELFLPPYFPYPINIVALAADLDATVERGTRLLSYSYTHAPATPGAMLEVRYGTWDSPIEGSVHKWSFKPGETVSASKAKEVPAVFITEPCKHGVQLHGLCCICGKDMTDYDHNGFSDTSRASIQMTHLANGPTVSLEEAQRIEKETAQHLIKSRKLSLIVDLDQTIVHATVDPTVGEWIAEGEAWEARQAKRAEARAAREHAQLSQKGEDDGEGNDSDSDETTSDTEDEVNPNWEALKDVRKFRLGPEALGQPRALRKDKSIEEGCMYYIKPRPGWKEFLQSMAQKYEMHVYTMGTRAYAEEVCAAIDPDGKIFGGRLLSRDESGSLTQKSLQRLFPSDQSMVVIIDDRADVWEWSPNLVKVIPYDFFVGIGDINSAFLPKLDPTMTASVTAPAAPAALAPSAPEQSTPAPASDPLPEGTPPSDGNPDLPLPAEPALVDQEAANELHQKEILARNAVALEAQVEERPLAKKQEKLQEAEEAAVQSGGAGTESGGASASGDGSAAAAESNDGAATPPVHQRKALLKNDDVELVRVQRILEDVHGQFYTAYDTKTAPRKPGRRASQPAPYDVRSIIPQMRSDVFKGVHILFSSVIPLDTRPEVTEIWKTAHAFGAKCYTELSRTITHVVATKRGTVKVDAARRQGGVKIVWLNWFTDSVALWERQDEVRYLIDPEPAAAAVRAASPPSDAHQISSDPEPDADDWDEERTAGTLGGRSLALDEVDWDEINDEVDAAMDESDDDDGGKSERGRRSANGSEDEWTDESNSMISSANSSPRMSRKRLRSLTPSESGLNGGSDPDVLRSPLSKRKKLAADRSGGSKLREEIRVEESEHSRENTPLAAAPFAEADEEEDEVSTTESDNDDDGAMEEDDFLARELEDEWT